MENENAFFDLLYEAVSLVARDDRAGAIETCEMALGIKPDAPEAHCVLAMIAAEMGDLGRAIELLEDAHKKAPDCQEYADVLAVIHARAGKLADSLYYAKLAVALESDPDMAGLIPPSFRDYKTALDRASPSPNYMNATTRFQQRRYAEAEEFCLRHLRLDKSDAAAYLLLGRSRMAQGKYDDALGDLHSAVHLDPADAEGYLRLGDCLTGLGRFDEGRACHEAAAALSPTDLAVRIAALASFRPLSGEAMERFAEESRKAFQACLTDVEPVDLPDRSDAGNGEKIRIGYLSDQFYGGAMGNLLGSLFAAHDRSRFELFAYQQNVHADQGTTRLKARVDHWKEICEIDDDTAAYIIAGDGLDILVDLCSYANDHRAGLLARKPAPIIAGWLSWPYGIGLSALDYVISAPAMLEADGQGGRAKCLPVAAGPLAYAPGAVNIDFDAFGESPVARNGFVTFGAVGDAARVTPEVVRVFSRVLRAVPGSCLMFGYAETICPAVRRRLQDLFSHFGLLDRIAFQTPTDEQPANLQFLANVDVVLDTFAANAVFETCEALRAGLPVVTLAGNSRSALMGASLLEAAGKASWVAASEDEFVDIAASLVADPDELARLRGALGEEVGKSALCDVRTFAAGLEEVFQQMVRGTAVGSVGGRDGGSGERPS